MTVETLFFGISLGSVKDFAYLWQQQSRQTTPGAMKVYGKN